MLRPLPVAVLAVLGAAALWGTTGTAQALGPEGSDPSSVGALRVAVGALALVVLVAPGRRGGSGTAHRGSPAGVAAGRNGLLGRLPAPALVAAGGLAVAAYQVCFFLGVARAGVAVGTVVALGVAPLATGLLGLVLGERPGRRWVVATAGAVAGVALLAGAAGPGGAGVDLGGVAAALGAGVSYACYTVAARTLLLRGRDGVAVMAAFFVVGALLLSPVLVVSDLRWLTTVPGLLMVLWLGLVATGLSYALFQHGLARLPAGTVATLSLAEPVTATVLGVLVLRESLTGAAAVGSVVVLLSLAVLALPARGRRAAAASGIPRDR